MSYRTGIELFKINSGDIRNDKPCIRDLSTSVSHDVSRELMMFAME